MRRMLALLATLALALAGLALTGGAASAKTRTIEDARRDVVLYQGGGETPQPGNRYLDIVSDTTSFEGSALTMSVAVRDLRSSGFQVVWRLIADGVQYTAAYDADATAGSRFVLYNEAMEECPGLDGKVRRRYDEVRIVVPRSCLQGADWVRVSTQTFAVADSQVALVPSYAGDDARRDGESSFFEPRYGKKLRRN